MIIFETSVQNWSTKKARIWHWWPKYSVNSDVDKFSSRSGAEFSPYSHTPSNRFPVYFLPTPEKVLKRGDLVGILTKKDLLHYVGEKRERQEFNNFHCLNF